MSRSIQAVLRLAILAASTGACQLRAAAPASPPNLVFMLADDLGWADTTLEPRSPYHHTPNLARLAARGMTFTRAYAASPLCSPTRSAILTGLSPARTGITTPNCHEARVVLRATPGTTAPPGQKSVPPLPPTRLDTRHRTLAGALREGGYATGHFGKWHLGADPYSPLQHGFDVDLPHHPGPGPAGSYLAPWKFRGFDPDPGVPNQHIEDRMAREAVAFLERNRHRRFFLNYWMFSVHAPFDAKPDLVEKYRRTARPGAAQRCPTYAAMVESMDDAVGTLLDALDRLGLADNTVVVFTSDNGGNMYSEVDGVVPTSNAPLRGGKATLFDGGTRVPCVVVWPGVTAAGSRSDALIQSEDFFPTFLEGFGLAPADGQVFDGRSLLPALRGGALEREGLFQYFPHSPPVPDWLPPAVSVHAGDWKLIRIFHGGERGAHRHLLYNLREDIGETRDLAALHPGRVEALDGLISGFLTRTDAVVPVANPAFDPAAHRPGLEGKPRVKDTQASAVPPAAPADEFPGLRGWKARNCTVEVKDGLLRVNVRGDDGFLGVGAGQASGPAVLRARLRVRPGRARVEWLPGGAAAGGQSAPWESTGTDWQTLAVPLPASGPLGIVRLHLPRQEEPVEIDWIELAPAGGGVRRWDF